MKSENFILAQFCDFFDQKEDQRLLLVALAVQSFSRAEGTHRKVGRFEFQCGKRSEKAVWVFIAKVAFIYHVIDTLQPFAANSEQLAGSRDYFRSDCAKQSFRRCELCKR